MQRSTTKKRHDKIRQESFYLMKKGLHSDEILINLSKKWGYAITTIRDILNGG